MRYVALLRGINVGGNNKIAMSELKLVFTQLGCGDVSTYINTGNVIFSDTRGKDVLTNLITEAIKTHFRLAVPIVLRTAADISHLIDHAPNDWTNDTLQKTDVMFLWDTIDDDSILQKIVTNPTVENVIYLPGALIWNIARENATKGNGILLVKSEHYRSMTVRNINTVRKLNLLLEGT